MMNSREEFLLRKELRSAPYVRALYVAVIDSLSGKASRLLIDAIVDAPYQEECGKDLALLRSKATEAQEQRSSTRLSYRWRKKEPSPLAIELDPRNPSDLDLFKRMAFCSIHAEVRVDDPQSGEQRQVLSADDSGQGLWVALTDEEKRLVDAWLRQQDRSFAEVFEPLER
jgi:hypothetical protein